MKKYLLTTALFLMMPSVAVQAQISHRRILYIGDSVTDGGWGRSGGSAAASEKRNHWGLNHIYGHSYMMLCAARLSAEQPEADDEFLNRGISGDDMTGLESRWQKDVLSLRPDVLSILIGTNDIHYWLEHAESPFDLGQWEWRYRQLLNRTKEANPSVRFDSPGSQGYGIAPTTSSIVHIRYRADISALLHSGSNRIDILVYSSLANHYQTIPSAYRGTPLSGLLGPVKMTVSTKE